MHAMFMHTQVLASCSVYLYVLYELWCKFVLCTCMRVRYSLRPRRRRGETCDLHKLASIKTIRCVENEHGAS